MPAGTSTRSGWTKPPTRAARSGGVICRLGTVPLALAALLCGQGLRAAVPLESTPTVTPDQWAATDALGRKLPDFASAPGPRAGKQVALFYWTWHTDNLADFSPVLNVTEILAQAPEAAHDASHPAWRGIWQGVFWWDEPLFGYYRTTDPWVLRKHAELLADAGVDAVFFDCTNGSFTWRTSYRRLLEVWAQARKDGVRTPQIAFLLAFGPSDGARQAIRELYEDLYRPGFHPELWYRWHGKPLIMAYPEMLADVPDDPAETRLRREIREFFTFRPGQPSYVTGPTRPDHWGWLENYPQHGYGTKDDGGFEQVTVGVAQNANDASGGHCYAFNAPGTYGRSYTRARGQDPRPDAYLHGLNFQEQWDRARALDPDLVFVTGWNEWIAGRHESWPPHNPFKPFAFPDQYDAERSRDLEPVKRWGRHGDVYYLQLVSNVRRFKGVSQPEPASAPQSFVIGRFEGWDRVRPAYAHYRGNTFPRDHAGQGQDLRYVNRTGRNDIVLARVARDDRYLYFYVETAAPLSPRTDPDWMRLFLDVDRDKNTGWEGYDHVVNRTPPRDQARLERSTGHGWDWQSVAAVDSAVAGHQLELRIDRHRLGLEHGPIDLEFKWSDNLPSPGRVMEFYVQGDAAPGGRFNFVYTAP